MAFSVDTTVAAGARSASAASDASIIVPGVAAMSSGGIKSASARRRRQRRAASFRAGLAAARLPDACNLPPPHNTAFASIRSYDEARSAGVTRRQNALPGTQNDFVQYNTCAVERLSHEVRQLAASLQSSAITISAAVAGMLAYDRGCQPQYSGSATHTAHGATVCRYFRRGECRYGSSCRFSHEDSDAISTPA